MVRRVLWASFFLLPLALLGCSLFGSKEEEAPADTGPQTSSLVTEEELITHNVTYTGLLEEGGATIYQEGSHRLMLSDGKMVILESAVDVSVPLALYVGKLVRVQGDVMPTVEAGGTLMKVREIAWIRREADAEGREAEVLRVICGGAAGITCPTGEVCLLGEETGVCVIEPTSREAEFIPSASRGGPREEEGEEMGEQPSSEAGSEAGSPDAMEEEEGAMDAEDSAGSSGSSPRAPELDAQGSGAGSTSAVDSPGAASAPSSDSADAKVTVMVEENVSAERWTQQYCSTHLSFCIPVHKNWYYKSFGATVSTLWHVEVGPGPIEQLGDGPLHIELKTGDLSGLGVAENAVTEVGGKVIGYRTWTENRHFEISAHPSLRDSVSHVTKGLRATE